MNSFLIGLGNHVKIFLASNSLRSYQVDVEYLNIRTVNQMKLKPLMVNY